jgi:hypothetical protein
VEESRVRGPYGGVEELRVRAHPGLALWPCYPRMCGLRPCAGERELRLGAARRGEKEWGCQPTRTAACGAGGGCCSALRWCAEGHRWPSPTRAAAHRREGHGREGVDSWLDLSGEAQSLSMEVELRSTRGHCRLR